jgi:peptidyl-prolyl cis-trans isomerase C
VAVSAIMAADEKIAATAGDVKVSFEEVQEVVEPQLEQMPQEMDAEQKKQFKRQALDNVIFQKLLKKEFDAKNITVSDKDVDARVEQVLSENKLTMGELKSRLNEMKMDYNEFYEQLRFDMKHLKMIDMMIAGGINITDEDARDYYEKNSQQFQVPEQVEASHILVQTNPQASEQEKAAAKEKIAAVKAKLDQGGDFAELAKENSDCPSGENGGHLGYFARERMVPSFSEVAFDLEEGQTSDIVETQFGYHIIKVTGRKEARDVPFSEAVDSIKKQMEETLRQEYATKFREKMLSDADIEYHEDFQINKN